MPEARVQRRLAAILAADVVGYTRLMRADEAATLDRLNALHRDLLDPRIAMFGGRVVKTTGDGILAEFSSAVDAVQFAVELQESMAGVEAGDTGEPRLQLRIGINVGDVIVEDDDLFGDGVNVAARLEGLSDPGGVCVSGSAHEQVRHKLDLVFEDMGGQIVKNIDEPVHAYRIVIVQPATGNATGTVSAEPAEGILRRPAVAVLPFDNMSGDEEQEYFADGITEDIITELSKWSWFPVIARNSTFTYKGTSLDVRRLADELGARYVVEGSVRKGGNRVRITAQLIDTATGHHIWAERYDRELEDVFAVQDEITMNVAGAVMPELSVAEQKAALRKPPGSLEAWDLYLRAQWHHSRFTREDLAEARSLLLRSVALDPQMAMAHAKISDILLWTMNMGWHEAPQTGLQEATEHAARALKFDGRNAHAHACMAWCEYYAGKPEDARRSGETAIDLNPSYAHGRIYAGNLFLFLGQPEATIEQLNIMRRLSPRDSLMFIADSFQGLASYLLGDFEGAIDQNRKAAQQNPEFLHTHFHLAAAYGQLGRLDEAEEALEAARRLRPDHPRAFFTGAWPFAKPADMDLFLDGLRMAGVTGL